jgi:hypothetical protein
MSAHSIINALGYAGLIPFIIPVVLVATGSGYTDLAIVIAETYAFGIICFLTGSWWGMASRTDSRSVILLSNIYFVTAFLLLFLTPEWWSFAASILLIGIFALEQIDTLFPSLPHYYRQMRAILTLISGSSMLIIHFAR